MGGEEEIDSDIKKNISIIPPPSVMAERDAVLQLASSGLVQFGRIFMPEDFLNKEASPAFHYDVGQQLIITTPGARICNVIPRGFGKSTLMKAAILYKIYFAQKDILNFICWIGETQDQAVDHIKYIRNHIEYNEKLRYYFGDLSGNMAGKRWTERDYITAKGDRIIAKGTTQRLRGKAEGSLRYTGIVLDDFESELNTKNKDRRAENSSWISSTVFPALEETGGREGWIWLSGTIVHYASFLQATVDGDKKAKEEKRKFPWIVNFFRGTNDGELSKDSIPLWPERFSVDKLKAKREEFIEAGTPHKFPQEYMNDARDRSMSPIRIERIHYHNAEFGSNKKDFTYLIMNNKIERGISDDADVIPIFVYVGVDIAGKAKHTSDFQAIVVMGIDCEGNRYVLEYFNEHIPAYDLADKVYELAVKYRQVRRVNFEDVGSQEIVRDIAERRSKEDRRLMRGIMKGVVPPRGMDKIDRLGTAIGSIVNSGKLYIRKGHIDLFNQMDQMPSPKYDDLLDALYYADYHARTMYPRSQPMKGKDFKIETTKAETKKRRKSRGFNWYTGIRR